MLVFAGEAEDLLDSSLVHSEQGVIKTFAYVAKFDCKFVSAFDKISHQFGFILLRRRQPIDESAFFAKSGIRFFCRLSSGESSGQVIECRPEIIEHISNELTNLSGGA